MPKIAYSEEEREHIREALIDTALELFVKQGIQHTTVEQIYTHVGISRTFFYTFFSTKEELILQALCHQRPIIVEHARRIMKDPDMSWRDGIRQFMRDCCYAGEGRFAVLNVEEQQVIFRHLSEENYEELQKQQIQFFSDILEAFGILADEASIKFIWNYVLSVVIVRKAVPNTLPLLFTEAADEMAEFQINALVDFMEKLQKQQH